MADWKRNFTSIIISRKFLGIWWDLWSVRLVPGDDPGKVFQETKNHYSRKWNGGQFKMRLYYGIDEYVVNKKV